MLSRNSHGIYENFNSIKVRLELAYAIGLFLAFLFQFHKGTIRTLLQSDAFKKFSISIP